MQGDKANGEYKLTISMESTPDQIGEMIDHVRSFAEVHLENDDLQTQTALAVNEALVNAAKHGNDFDVSKTATVHVRVNDDSIQVSVEDEGHGFEPAAVQSPLTEENMLRDHGRGLHIMETIADDVSYENGGRRVRLGIHRAVHE